MEQLLFCWEAGETEPSADRGEPETRTEDL